MATHPAYLPSVPRIFEKIYTLVTSNNDVEKIKAATQLGLKVRRMMAAGEPVPEQLQAAFDQADAELYANVRNIFGGQLKQATSGAAPIGREILEFFYACGAPGAGGLRDDRDLHRRHHVHGRRPQARHGRPGAPGLARSGSPTTARSSSAARTSSAATTAPGTRPRSAPSTRRAGCTPAISASSTTRAT